MMNSIIYLPFYIVSRMPFSVLYLLSDITYFIVFHFVKYRRKVVRMNLINSFPNKSASEIDRIEKGFYKHLSDVTFESIKVLTISRKSALKRMQFKNADLIVDFERKKRSLIMYTAHIGNWEWLSFMPLSLGIKITTLYKPLSNKYFDRLMKIVRSRHGIDCIEANKGYKSILNSINSGTVTFDFIVGDQRPRNNAAMHWTMFLNRETPFSVGADRIAKKTDQVLVYPFFRKLSRGYYEVEFQLIEEFPKQSSGEEIIDKYVSLLEKNIKKSPEMYLWSHKRWKLCKPKIKKDLNSKLFSIDLNF